MLWGREIEIFMSNPLQYSHRLPALLCKEENIDIIGAL
jgi:hypothetical protein